MKDFISKHKYVVIVVLSIILILFLVMGVLLNSKPRTEQGSNSQLPSGSTPTISNSTQNNSGNGQINVDSPDITLPPANPFTGVKEPDFSQQEISAIEERRKLRHLTPYNQGDFLIDFNFKEDYFTVRFISETGQSKEQFRQWMQLNYPLIDISTFTYL